MENTAICEIITADTPEQPDKTVKYRLKKLKQPQKVATEEKRPPGRPPKIAQVIAYVPHGIIATPRDSNSAVELAYSKPAMFKQLIHMFKNFGVGEFEMYFTTTRVEIMATDHLKKSNIYVTLDGSRMSEYYCKYPLLASINRKDLDNVFAALEKTSTHDYIRFSIEDGVAYKPIMKIVMRGIEYNNNDIYDIPIKLKTIPNNFSVMGTDDDTDYPVYFNLAAKHFKQKISAIGKMSQMLIIRKNGDSPLELTFEQSQSARYICNYEDPDKIKLRSSIRSGDLLSVSICIEYIKPFSNSGVGDNIDIAVDRREKLSLTTTLDVHEHMWAVRVKIFTEIKNYSAI